MSRRMIDRTGCKSWRLFHEAIAVLAAATVATSAAFAGDASVIARVGESDVTLSDIRGALDSLDPRERSALTKDPSLLNQVVRTLLVQRLVLQEAKARDWEAKPEIAARIERQRQQTIMESYVEAMSVPPADYPSESDLKKTYESSKPVLLVPRQFQLAQIFVASPKDADKATSDRAQIKLDGVRQSVRQGDADFAEIARARSDDSDSASRGGDIGWLTEARIQPDIRARVATMTRGSVSDPIRLDDGWHIVKVLDVKEACTPSLEEIRVQLVQQMRTERTQALRQAFLAKLLQDHPVRVNELTLASALDKPGK